METVKTRIKADDKVKIVAGKDKGKVGKVLKLNKKTNRVIVENVNIVKNHVKPSPANRQGGIVEKESPIHLSNVMPVCGSCMKPVRIKSKTLEDGKKLRMCAKCNEALDA